MLQMAKDFSRGSTILGELTLRFNIFSPVWARLLLRKSNLSRRPFRLLDLAGSRC